MTNRRYEEMTYNGQTIRRIIDSEKPNEIGKYRCYCSQIIKDLKTFDNHFHTKSHHANVEYIQTNRPDVYYNTTGKLRFLVDLK